MSGFKKISLSITWLSISVLLFSLFFAQQIAAAAYTVCAEGCSYTTIQAAIDAASPGDTILLAAGSYPEQVTLDKRLTLLLNGAAVGAGSPAITIAADDITIRGPGVLDGGGSAGAGILVQAGADNFILDRVEVTGWRDGLELAGAVTSFKVVNTWFHDNSAAGLQINEAAALSGVVTIEGNLFKENGGAGIQNDSGQLVIAKNNSWGHIDGPEFGDTVSALVQAAPWNYFEIYLDMHPDNGALLREVGEGETLELKLNLDAHLIYGFTVKLNWDADYVVFNSATLNPDWADYCTSSSSATEFTAVCYLEYDQPQYSAVGGNFAALNFSAKTGAGLSGNGPWQTLFDISHLESDTSAAAVGGAKVWVNNAGYGAASAPARDISDADDGQLIINAVPNYSGEVLLEGRSNRSGAQVHVLDITDKATSVVLASASSAANGTYFTAYLPAHVLTLGSTYALYIDRDLYLPTTILSVDQNLNPLPLIPDYWMHAKLLSTLRYTPLANVLLLGGDANNDNVIDILDAGCIGRDYGQTPQACGVGGSSDVNGDGVVDMADLTLMSGNYTKNYSPWIP